MPKCSMIHRLLHTSIIKCLIHTMCIVALIHHFGFYGTYNYDHIAEDKLLNELYRETVPDLHKTKLDCNYDNVLKNNRTINSWDVPKTYDDFSPNGISSGGSYVPQHCNPAFSVAIIVTYRNRQKQLDIFLPYMHNFLRRQNIHYKIYLIEQRDENPWNKGLLYNIGARRAIADKFPCLILHDVDLLPLDEGNLYACARHPRHLSASIDKFRFVLPYNWLVGGVLAIKADHYVSVNGFSNRFKAWGGEDDDFYNRISKQELSVLRFPRTLSRYTMLVHKQEKKNKDRQRIMAESRPDDGYSSADYRALVVTSHRLFTLLAVQT